MADIALKVEMGLAGPDGAAVDVTSRTRGCQWRGGRRQGRLDPETGTARVTIDDDDNFFRPGNPDSTHKPADSDGGAVTVDAAVGSRSARMWTGTIDRPESIPRQRTTDTAISCVDRLSKLINAPLTLGPRPRELTGRRFQAILAAAGETNFVAASGLAYCDAVGFDTADTVLGHLLRCVNTELGGMSVGVGRLAGGELRFSTFDDPHRIDANVYATLTDQPTADDDIFMASQPGIVAEDPTVLINAVNTYPPHPAGTERPEPIRSVWEDQIRRRGERARDNPVWVGGADAARNGLRWLGVYGRPLLLAKQVTIRCDAQTDDAAVKALGARIGDRVNLQFLQQSGASSTTPLDRQFFITGIGGRSAPLEPPYATVELQWDLLPAQELSFWTLGRSRLGPPGTGADRTVPWPGGVSDPSEPVRPRNWNAADRVDVTAVDFDRLLRRRVVARYTDLRTLRVGEGREPLPGQLAITTGGSAHVLYAWGSATGWTEVART